MWVNIPNQVQNLATRAPNYNDVTFAPVIAQQVRVLMTRATGFTIELKEIQLLNGTRTPPSSARLRARPPYAVDLPLWERVLARGPGCSAHWTNDP